MKSLTLLALIGYSNAVETENNFKFLKYVSKFAKGYKTVKEFEERLKNWLKSEQYIQKHNMTNGATYGVGHNKFSDWSEQEYSDFLTYKGDYELREHKEEDLHVPGATYATVDWRTKNAVNPIQDQGNCGSCWAFSSIFSIEAAHAVKSGELLKFSEQQLVDCDTGNSNAGCNGGDVDVSWKYFYESSAVLENDYQYTATNGTCLYSTLPNSGINVSDYFAVTRNSPDSMKAALVRQPIKVSIRASDNSFRLYTGGIYNDAACGTEHNHAVAVVGWGEENGVEYWILRNSWGTDWGEAGYGKLQIIEGNGNCGIQMWPFYPVTNM